MSVELGYDHLPEKFESLQLSIPIDVSQFDYIKEFLVNFLNLEDPTKILQSDDVNGKFYNVEITKEILPGITLPNDIWLRSNINIKDIKVKISILTEINSMIEKELEKTDEILDDTVLLYYKKLLMAYKFYETPKRNSLRHYSIDSLKEEEEEETDEYTVDENKSLNRTVSNQSSTTSLRTHHSYFSHSSNNNVSSHSNQSNNFNYNNLNSSSGKRNSSSRENILSRKRFSSLMGNQQQPPSQITSPISGTFNLQNNGQVFNLEYEEEEPEEDNRKSFNSILSKSKIYSRMMKNRELSSSMNSNSSNRNSISTTATTNSNNSKMKRNSINEEKHHSNQSLPLFVNYSLNQRQEIQKNKFEYFIQVKQLLLWINKIISHLSVDARNNKLFKLMDFIKRFIFKFIVLDASELVTNYGDVEAYRMYSRLK